MLKKDIMKNLQIPYVDLPKVGLISNRLPVVSSEKGIFE